MKARQFDRAFEAGKDVTDVLDVANARRPKHRAKRVNVDFPEWMVDRLDWEASRLGITRQSLIKVWLAQQLERSARETAEPD